MAKRKEPTREETRAAYSRIFKEDPALRKYYTLIVRYAEQKGGLTLAFWKIHRGGPFLHPDFNHPDAEPGPRSVGETAERLGVPVSTAEKILAETSDAVRPLYFASPEYKGDQKRLEIQKTRPKDPPTRP